MRYFSCYSSCSSTGTIVGINNFIHKKSHKGCFLLLTRLFCPSTLTESLKGGSRIFFRRGCTHLLLYFNTNKPHSFFFRRIPVVLENRRGGRGVQLLHPPPRSAPEPGTGLEGTIQNFPYSLKVNVPVKFSCMLNNFMWLVQSVDY